MSRLTLPHHGGKGHYMKCSESLACNGNCGDCDSLDEIVEKLAEYEDKEEQESQTNADRIRAMSDEELAEFLCSLNVCKLCNGDEEESIACHCHANCQRRITGWLRQAVKDGEDE